MKMRALGCVDTATLKSLFVSPLRCHCIFKEVKVAAYRESVGKVRLPSQCKERAKRGRSQVAIQIIREEGRPDKFQAQIRIPGEKSESKTFSTFEAAEEFERNAMAAIRMARSSAETRRVYGRQMKPTGVASLAAMRVAQIAAEFAKAEPEHRFAIYVPKVMRLVEEARVCDLDKNWTKRFCEKLRKVKAGRRNNCLAESSIGQYVAMIRRMCNWKAEELGLDKPRLGLTKKFLEPGWDDSRERRLRGDEEERIRQELGRVGARRLRKKIHPAGARGKPMACARHYQLLFDFAIETCARQEEMVDLPWKELDLAQRIWALPASRSKTGRRRKIYLTPLAVGILNELRLDRKLGGDRAFHRLPTAASVSSTFHEAIVRLGIEDLVFHDLRHEGITRHRMAKNFEPEVLMRMVGHSSPQMTMVYFNPEDGEVLAQMDAAMLRKHVTALPVADALQTAEKLLAGRLEVLMSSLAANALDLGGDPALAQTRLAAQLRELLAPAPIEFAAHPRAETLRL